MDSYVDSLGSMGCEWYNFWWISSVLTLFLYYFSLCCSRFHVVAMLPDSKDRNMLQVFFWQKKNMYSKHLCDVQEQLWRFWTLTFVCFVNAGRFFLNFQLTKHVALYAQLLWRKSQKTWTCCGIIKQKCIYTHVSLSGICIVNVMLVYPQQTMYWTHIYGSKCFAFVAAAFLLLHFVYWFLNHVAIPCERKGPKGVGW